MGILNVTPDSFYDGGRWEKTDAAVRRGLRMIEAGADVVDVGGQSTRPGSSPVPIREEIRRVVPVVRALRARCDVPSYDDVVDEVRDFLERRARRAIEAGVPADKLLVDPGIGFGKKLEHNRALLQNVGTLQASGYPLVIGHSRKSFLGEVLGREAPDRLAGTLAVSGYLMEAGVDVLRVHDVADHRDLRRTRDWLRRD